jgi:hypothetical protein
MKETQICYKCKEEKLIADFYNNKSKPGGHDYECKLCKNEHVKEFNKQNPELKREYTRKATKKYRDARKDTPEWKLKRRLEQLKINYDLSEEQFNALLFKQNNKCAICQKEFIGIPRVDHCHTRNKVRGLLCHYCNTGIGLFYDSHDLLIRAANYIAINSQ